MVTAQIKMKALVVSRLMLGDIPDWRTFEDERKTASDIVNRRAARSVSSQIGRNYRYLSAATQKFVEENFAHAEYHDLARLCDEVKSGSGLSICLDEFEKTFFPLADRISSVTTVGRCSASSVTGMLPLTTRTVWQLFDGQDMLTEVC